MLSAHFFLEGRKQLSFPLPLRFCCCCGIAWVHFPMIRGRARSYGTRGDRFHAGSLAFPGACTWLDCRFCACRFMSKPGISWNDPLAWMRIKMWCWLLLSDSEEFDSRQMSSLPLSGQEAHPSLSYLELLDVLSHVFNKLNLEWSDTARPETWSKLDNFFLAGHSTCPPLKPCPFSPRISNSRFWNPGNRHPRWAYSMKQYCSFWSTRAISRPVGVLYVHPGPRIPYWAQSGPQSQVLAVKHMMPFSAHLAVWQLLPNVSRWVLWTIQGRYVIQFQQCLPLFMEYSPQWSAVRRPRYCGEKSAPCCKTRP